MSEKRKNIKEYWFCKIGPIDKSKLKWGTDYPLRSIVKAKFVEMFGKGAEVCSSGWGLTEEMKTRLDIITLLPITDPKTLAKIDKLLINRNMK